MQLDNSLHLIMQSKGGAGKSVVAYILSQYLLNRLGRKNVHLVDIDPNNKTLSKFADLKVEQVSILKDDGSNTIDQSKFDYFVESFLENRNGSVYMVDTGSGEHLELNNYLLSMNMAEMLADSGKTLYIHVPIVYGDAESDTKASLANITTTYPSAKIIVWENEYFETVSSKPIGALLESGTFSNLVGLVNIKKLNKDTFEKDFKNALKDGKTFAEVQNSKANVLVKKRLHDIEKDFQLKLDTIFAEVAEPVSVKAEKSK